MKYVHVSLTVHASVLCCVCLSAGWFLNLILLPSCIWLCDPKGRSSPSLPGCKVMKRAQIMKISPSCCHWHTSGANGRALISLFPTQCRLSEWPGGLVKDRDGDGKHIEIRSGWLDATLDFHSVIDELLWLTLSLTSVRQDEDGSKWLLCGSSCNCQKEKRENREFKKRERGSLSS